jgi:GPH family glycoside/pentoside/hexuronide:cation symporter
MCSRSTWIYGSGDFGFSLTTTIVDADSAIFLTDLADIKPAVAGAAIFIGRSSHYLNDPLAGYLSDRTRTRWGRRRPFLLFRALPFALAFTLLWRRPPVANGVVLAVYYAAAYVLFILGATFTSLPQCLCSRQPSSLAATPTYWQGSSRR